MEVFGGNACQPVKSYYYHATIIFVSFAVAVVTLTLKQPVYCCRFHRSFQALLQYFLYNLASKYPELTCT